MRMQGPRSIFGDPFSCAHPGWSESPVWFWRVVRPLGGGAGYLARGAYDARAAVPPPPAAGSAVAEQDRATFLATRKLKDSPRWSLARQDARETKAAEAFSCALGVTPTRETTPRLAALLLRTSRDVRPAISAPKRLYDRKRPYQTLDGPICVRSGTDHGHDLGLPVWPRHLGLDRGPDPGQGPAGQGRRDPGPRPGLMAKAAWSAACAQRLVGGSRPEER